MATFGAIVDATEIKPAKAVRTPRDMSYMADYRNAVETLQSEGPGKYGTMANVVDKAEMTRERNRLKSAASDLGIVLGFSYKPDNGLLAYTIEPGKTPKPSAYDRLSEEAKAAGITLKELKARKAAEKAAAGEPPPSGKRGRPAKNAAPVQGELVGATA
jgi:hypothetical protein